MNKDIRIKNIQDNITENKCVEIDFKDNISIVITKDNVYIKRWDDRCPSIRNIYLWDLSKADDFDKYEYILIEDFTDLEVNDIIQTMFEECKYQTHDGILYKYEGEE